LNLHGSFRLKICCPSLQLSCGASCCDNCCGGGCYPCCSPCGGYGGYGCGGYCGGADCSGQVPGPWYAYWPNAAGVMTGPAYPNWTLADHFQVSAPIYPYWPASPSPYYPATANDFGGGAYQPVGYYPGYWYGR
jgi:hypothetical protein